MRLIQNPVVDNLFNAALRRIDGLYSKCEELTGCIGVQTKCHTCCGSVSIVAVSIMTAAFAAGHLAWHFYLDLKFSNILR